MGAELERFLQPHRSPRQPVGQGLAVNQLHDEKAGVFLALEAMVVAEEWWERNQCGRHVDAGERIKILRYETGEVIDRWVGDYVGPA